MDCTPEQAKDFVLELQSYAYTLIKNKFPEKLHTDCLDLATEFVDYAFALMLKTHRGESIKPLIDDDVPF